MDSHQSKGMTEEEFRSSYPQVSIQHLSDKASPKVMPSVEKRQIVRTTPSKAVVMQKTSLPLKSPPASKTQTLKAGQNVEVKTSAPVMKLSPAVTKTPISPLASVKNVMVKTHAVTKTSRPIEVKSPVLTKTPVMTKSPLMAKSSVVAKTAVMVKTPLQSSIPTPSKLRAPAGIVKSVGIKTATASSLKATPTKVTPVRTVQNVVKQQIPNLVKAPVKTTAALSLKEESPDQSTMTVLTYHMPHSIPQRSSNQLTIEKIDQQQRIPVVLDSNNPVVLQQFINNGQQIVLQNRISPAETNLQSLVIGTTDQATPVVVQSPLPQVEITTSEPLQSLQVTQQVTLFRPKGNTFTVDDVKNQISLNKQNAMTNVVSSTTNSIPTPASVPTQAVQPEQKVVVARGQAISQSPVRQSKHSTDRVIPKVAQKAPVTRQYQTTRGQMKKVSLKRDIPMQKVSPMQPPPLPPAELQYSGNEEEVSTSEDMPQDIKDSTKIVLILPSGEKKEMTIPRELAFSTTISDLLSGVTGNPSLPESIIQSGVTAEITDTADDEMFQEMEASDQWTSSHHIGPEPGEILGLGNEMDSGELDGETTDQGIQSESDALLKDSDSVNSEPLYRPGLLAVCKSCGYLSTDFNTCQRCKRKLPSTCKSVPVDFTQKSRKTKADSLTGESPKKKRVCRKRKPEEPVCLTISDDEELLGLAHHAQMMPEESFHSDSNSQLSSCDKEPVITDDMITEMKHSVSGGGREMEELLDNPSPDEKTYLQCRTVRIGSYKVVPKDKVLITPHGLKVTVPVLNSDQYVELKILYQEVIKVLIHFGRQMPVLFFYTRPSAAAKIRKALKMEDKKGFYYDTTSSDETHRRITFLPDKIDEDCKQTLKTIFSDPETNVFAELTGKEANDILVKASPKEVQAFILKKQPNNQQQQQQQQPLPFNGQDIQTIMVYPPPPEKGGIPINTEDYACLGEDQFLNDVIIDFYLKYVLEKMLSPSDRSRTHVFSSFFYKRLTTKPPPKRKSMNPVENDPAASAAQKRHSRVKSWTKNVNLFTKDFIVIPINESSHWFLAIICFPGLTGPVRFADNTPIDLPGRKKKINDNTAAVGALSGKHTVTIGSTTITAVALSAKMTSTLDVMDDGEDRDEADGEDENMDVPDSDEDPIQKPVLPGLKEEPEEEQVMTTRRKQREPIKQPCILIFDSLAGASRSRVVATLRDYLRVEYETKHGETRDFSGDVMKGTNLRCPQQTNYTDCGLYVLQYVEAFFLWPITDYHIPIKQLQDWFQADIVSRKRYEIQQLLHRLMAEQNIDIEVLNLPLLNLRPEGKHLVEYSGSEEEDEDDDQMCEDEEDDMMDDDGEYNEDMEHENEEMEDGEIVHNDEEDPDSFIDPSIDHEHHEMDEEDYGMGEDEDDEEDEEEEMLQEEEEQGEKELDDVSLTPVGHVKRKDLKSYRIPRLIKSDDMTENA